jgi:hypothetical protein
VESVLLIIPIEKRAAMLLTFATFMLTSGFLPAGATYAMTASVTAGLIFERIAIIFKK